MKTNFWFFSESMTSNILQNILKKKDQGVLESQNVHKDNTNPDITNKTDEELNNLLKNKDFSKNFKKKILKQLKWNQTVEERKLKRKADRKIQKEKEKLKKLKYDEKIKNNDEKTLLESVPYRICKKRKLACSELSSIKENFHVAIDLSGDLDRLMTCVMVRNLATQLSWVYKVNRKLKHPSQIWFCDMQERLSTLMEKQYSGYKNWDLNHFDGKSFLDIESVKQEPDPKLTSVVYLSADSETTLTSFKKGTIYVIGGLVDRNAHKNYCQNKAEKLNIQTAKLPLNEFVDFSEINRPLTVNHVAEIIVKINNRVVDGGIGEEEQTFENGNYKEIWREVILDVLPLRKGAQVKEKEVKEEIKEEASTEVKEEVKEEATSEVKIEPYEV